VPPRDKVFDKPVNDAFNAALPGWGDWARAWRNHCDPHS